MTRKERFARNLRLPTDTPPSASVNLPTPASACQSTAQIISATTKLAKNAGDANDGSADGLRLVAGESQDLGEQVLSGVYRMIKAADPQVDVVLLDTAISAA